MMKLLRILLPLMAIVLLAGTARAQRQMENLGRGVVALRISSTQVYVGWRMLGTDPDSIGFNLYRSCNGGAAVKLNSQPLTVTTDYIDTPPGLALPNSYSVRAVLDGVEQAASAAFTLPANMPVPTDHQNHIAPYLSVPLHVPAGGTNASGAYTYTPNDCSVGDLDGDGELEIILKWDPTDSQDNSISGYTGNVYLDAYEMDGAFLWRIDLGINIRAGAHYTQFMVYDLDGDGRAELACRTAPGTKDGLGNHVIMTGDNPDAVERNSSGYILTGPEYLTIFDGLTGGELATTPFYPDRGNVTQWGDNYGNRADRFLAGIAYLDGVRPSLIMARGYYGPRSGYTARNEITAWNWRDGELTMEWWFKAGQGINNNINSDYIGQGNHQLCVADVDGDGRDEIVYGACCIDDDGSGLYTTGNNHGDALHVSDMDPDHPGLEVWDVHEDGPTFARGGEFRDARTGELIWGIEATSDVGRGLAAHIDRRYPGYQMWSSATSGVLNREGGLVSSSRPSINFVLWWDADLQRELFDNAGDGGAATKLDKWTGSGVTRLLSPYSVDEGAKNNNTTKSNPCLSGDILGDWREEFICRNANNDKLMIFVSPQKATNRFRTLLHDSQYREALAWQNVAYNQPPHPSFYLGAGMAEPAPYLISDADRVWVGDGISNVWSSSDLQDWRINGVWTNTVPAAFEQGLDVLFDMSASTADVTLEGSLQPGAVKVQSPTDYTFGGNGSLDGSMSLTKAGTGLLTIDTTNAYSGATTVWEGGLVVNGSLGRSPVTVKRSVWLDSFVGGTGVLGQGLILEAGAVAPGSENPGTITVSNVLAEAGGVVNRFDLSSSPDGQNDLIRVEGDLTVEGVNAIEINALDGTLSEEGIYTLFEYTGSFNGSLTNFYVTGPYAGGALLINAPGAIQMIMITNVAPGSVTLIAAGADWRYLDNGSDAGTAWRERTFNDSSWSSGPAELGYGDSDEATVIRYGSDAANKYVTTYFRNGFPIEDPAQVGILTLSLKRDDGGIVYLNGTEVFRSNMPTGAVDYLTYTPVHTPDDGKTWFSTNLPPALLVAGDNVLAVEIHQSTPTSSDLSFDCELVGSPAPEIGQVRHGQDWILFWPDSEYLLESAPLLEGPWQPVGTSGPYPVPFTDPQQFYRLKKP